MKRDRRHENRDVLAFTCQHPTESYAHLSDSPIRKVANQVSERVQASFPIARSNDDPGDEQRRRA